MYKFVSSSFVSKLYLESRFFEHTCGVFTPSFTLNNNMSIRRHRTYSWWKIVTVPVAVAGTKTYYITTLNLTWHMQTWVACIFPMFELAWCKSTRIYRNTCTCIHISISTGDHSLPVLQVIEEKQVQHGSRALRECLLPESSADYAREFARSERAGENRKAFFWTGMWLGFCTIRMNFQNEKNNKKKWALLLTFDQDMILEWEKNEKKWALLLTFDQDMILEWEKNEKKMSSSFDIRPGHDFGMRKKWEKNKKKTSFPRENSFFLIGGPFCWWYVEENSFGIRKKWVFPGKTHFFWLVDHFAGDI